jgi:hypothetical protein
MMAEVITCPYGNKCAQLFTGSRVIFSCRLLRGRRVSVTDGTKVYLIANAM